MLKFKQFIIKEEQQTSHHLTFVRGNPIHAGHEAVVNQTQGAAEATGGGHSIVFSRSQDSKKNPLTPEQKIRYARMAFPSANVQLATPQQPTLLHIASSLHDQGVKHLHLHVGSDRVEEFQKLLNQYNGQRRDDGEPMQHGYYGFDSIHVHPVGDSRDEEGTGMAGYSATKMRDAAQRGDRAAFHAMAPSAMTPEQKDAMMQDTYTGMNPPPKETTKKTKKTK
jgi:hypothetical protein